MLLAPGSRWRPPSGRSTTIADAASMNAKPMASVQVGRSPRTIIAVMTPITGEARMPSAAVDAGSRRTISNHRK